MGRWKLWPFLAVCAGSILLPAAVYAGDVGQDAAKDNLEEGEKSGWSANIKRIAVEYTEHSVTNKKDPNYPESYNADEQSSIGGIFDGNLTYRDGGMLWVNGLYMQYDKSDTTEDGVRTENENEDEILLYTDYTHKIWTLDEGKIGPFAYLGYETEFTDFNLDGTDYRTRILRAKGGMKFYDGTYFKQLYAAMVEENDMTYRNDNMKTGAEIGYEFNYPLNENTSFVSEGYYRHFFAYGQKEATDFEYRFKTRNRIETRWTGDLYLAPFYDYELAKTRGASKSRAQSTFGLSLSYNKSFDLPG